MEMTTRYERIEIEINTHSNSSHVYEGRIRDMEAELKRLKLALKTMQETHEND